MRLTDAQVELVRDAIANRAPEIASRVSLSRSGEVTPPEFAQAVIDAIADEMLLTGLVGPTNAAELGEGGIALGHVLGLINNANMPDL